MDLAFFASPYSFGGIKYFANFNRRWPFIQCKMETAIIPFANQTGVLFLIFYANITNNTINIIRILIYITFHLTPLFNPIICILTNTPYRNAIFKRLQILPQ
uniref:G_PROTEIN_RECEP_F1_2 domain-containing protein n=1 Tax=Meloidogyne hapla TaxID=6305 RepID=A0A1I8AXA0_MELHA